MMSDSCNKISKKYPEYSLDSFYTIKTCIFSPNSTNSTNFWFRKGQIDEYIHIDKNIKKDKIKIISFDGIPNFVYKDIICDYLAKFKNLEILVYYKLGLNFLELYGLKKIIELDCSLNNLVDLSNLPMGLKILNCSKNKVCCLNNLPSSIIILNCDYNKLGELDLLPDGLVQLSCMNNSLKKLDNLPRNLIFLDCTSNILVELNCLPNGLKYLQCSFNQLCKLDNLPQTLINLFCSHNKIIIFQTFPRDLLNLNCSFNQIEYIYIPSNLHSLHCKNNIGIRLENITHRLKILYKD